MLKAHESVDVCVAEKAKNIDIFTLMIEIVQLLDVNKWSWCLLESFF